MPLQLIKKDTINKNVKSSLIEISVYQMDFSGILTEADIPLFKKHFTDCLNNPSPFGAIFNLSSVENAQPNLVVSLISYMREYEAQAKNKLVASCVIIKNDALRAIVNTLLSLKAPIAPNILVNDLDDGLEFIEDHISLYRINLRKSR